MIPIIILSACGPAVPIGLEQLPDAQVQVSPTMFQPTAATRSAESTPQTAQVVPLFGVRVTTVRSGARVLRGESITDVQQAQSANIQVDDGIEVFKPEGQAEQGYSILDFADHMEVELFSNTSVFLKGLIPGTGDSNHISLDLDGGHMFLHLNEQKATRVTVQTLYATIRALTDGAEFDLCHNEELTCILVK